MSTPKLRPIRVEDLPRIAAIHQQQLEQLGLNAHDFPLPDPYQKRIFQVAVGEQDGQIIGAAFYEAEVEVQFVATNPEFVRLMRKEQVNQERSLYLRDFRTLRAFIPAHLGQVAAMNRKGFAWMNPKWNCFVKTWE